MAGADVEIDGADYVLPEHQEEMEVLQSIFDGEENFKVVNSTTIQYKVGEDEEPLSILVEIKWNENYPHYIPTFNLDCFYNQHLPPAAKKEAMAALIEQARKYEGEQQTYTLIEWMKENILQLIGPYVFDEMCRLENRENEDDPEAAKEEDEEKSKESRKEQLTKAQKRREWNRKGKEGKMERGHDWVDVVRHLSQTGGGTPLTGAEDSVAAPKPVVEAAAAIPPNPNS